MSKTTTHNSESREVRELTERELKDHELELVSGGYVKQFEAGTAGDDQLFGSDYADSIFGFAGMTCCAAAPAIEICDRVKASIATSEVFELNS